MYVQLNLVSIMSVTDCEPIFYINIKKSGKKCHKFLIGEHTVNTETEITLSQLKDEVLERSIMDFQQAGPSCQQVEELYGPPRQHNMYGSGDMSSQLVDDFGQPICRMRKRSMSRS